jgi:hypothetical protein
MKLATTAVVVGAFGAILGAFFIAPLVGLVFRFPVPFRGYVSGPAAIGPSIFAVLFFEFEGGFPIFAILGAIGGGIAYAIGRPKTKFVLFLSLGFALTIDLLASLLMAVLDKLIGPW